MLDHAALDQFVEALVAGRRDECSRRVNDLLASGIPVRALYEQLFTAALYAIGDRWERGEVSVAVEHRATAICDALLVNLFPRVLSRESTGRSAVVSCTADEYHQLGGRIVADVLALAGWDVRFLGAGASIPRLLSEVRIVRPDLVALSVAIGAHLSRVREAAMAVRVEHPSLPIFVGGRAVAIPEPESRAELTAIASIARVEIVSSLEALEARVARWDVRA